MKVDPREIGSTKTCPLVSNAVNKIRRELCSTARRGWIRTATEVRIFWRPAEATRQNQRDKMDFIVTPSGHNVPGGKRKAAEDSGLYQQSVDVAL
jgi:hypothetical protein